MGIFEPTVDWRQRVQASYYILIKTSNVSHANMGDSWHKGDHLCASMYKHVQTGQHRPSNALYMALVSKGGETPKTNLSICSYW